MSLEQRLINYRAFYPHLGRLALCGLSWSIIDALVGRLPEPTWSVWSAACEAMAHEREPYSAAEAAALLHFAEFKETSNLDRKLALQARMRALFAHVRAESAWESHALTIETPREKFPAWCVERACKNSAPRVMILLNGLDSVKEIELWYFANGFLRAGIDACVLIDGPGQGEARAVHPLDVAAFTPMVERAARTLRARFGARCDITLFGVSFGGFLAAQIAGATHAIHRALCFSCCTDWSHLATLPPDVQALFAYAAHVPQSESVAWAAQHLRGTAGPPRVPVRIDHGVEDRIMPIAACRQLAATYPHQIQLHEYTDGHVFLHHVQDVIPQATQWILGQEGLCANL